MPNHQNNKRWWRPPKRQFDKLRFRKGQRILCRPVVEEIISADNPIWVPCIIAGINYCPNSKTIVPYSVRLLAPDGSSQSSVSGFVPDDTDERCLPLTVENFLKVGRYGRTGTDFSALFHELCGSLLHKKGEKEGLELLQMAASLRMPPAVFRSIVSHCGLPNDCLKDLGMELLESVLHAKEDYRLPFVVTTDDYSESREEIALGLVEELGELLEFLEAEAGVYVQDYRDDHGRNWEHIAVLTGDAILLDTMLKEDSKRCRLANRELEADVFGLCPLHYYLFCYSDRHQISIARKEELLNCYCDRLPQYLSYRDWKMKTPTGLTASELIHTRTCDNLWKSQLELFEDSICMCRGAYGGRSPTVKEMEGLRQFWRTFEFMLLHETIYDAMDAQVAGPYDHMELQRLVDEHDLDVSPHDSDGLPIDAKAAVFNAAKCGRFGQFQWLLEDLRFAQVDAVNAQGESLLEVAAKFSPEIRQNQQSLSTGPPERRAAAVREANAAKVQIFDEYDGGECHSCPDRLLPSNIDGSFCDRTSRLLQGPKDRIQIVDLMYKHGLPLPTTTNFCIRECDFPTAKRLLELKINYSEAVETLFKDHAPNAMDLVKRFLFVTAAGETIETLEDMAQKCLEKHSWDVQDLLEISRLCLLQWLVHEKGVIDPSTYRLHDGDTLLHLAIRNRQALAAKWLCTTYPALCRVRGGRKGQLPVHVAVDGTVLVEADPMQISLWRRIFTSVMDGAADKSKPGINVWDLQDAEGRSLRNYANHCVHTETW